MSAAAGSSNWIDGPPATAYLGEPEVDPDSIEHPAWCSRERCTAHRRGGDHWSAPWRIEPPERTGFPLIELALWTDAYQSPHESPAWVEMRLIHPSLCRTLAIAAYELEPEQMDRFAAVLTEVATKVREINERARAAEQAAEQAADEAEGGGDDDR